MKFTIRCPVSLDTSPKYISYSLTSLKGGYIRDYMWATIGGLKGDTRSLDYSSYGTHRVLVEPKPET